MIASMAMAGKLTGCIDEGKLTSMLEGIGNYWAAVTNALINIQMKHYNFNSDNDDDNDDELL